MAPNHYTANTGAHWLDPNRHSSRIVNKNTQKLDISSINSKINFMQSLDLFCVANTRESIEKINWDVVVSNNSLPLKPCSVIINDLNISSIDSRANKNEHSVIKINGNKAVIQENSRNLSKEEENITSSERRKSKEALTKVTLKIGKEVISNIYCKKKYLNKKCSKEQKLSPVHLTEKCNNCMKIKNTLLNTKKNAQTITDVKPSKVEESDCSSKRIRKLAIALVEHEVQQSLLRSLNLSNSINQDESNTNSEEENFSDDDILEISPITYNSHKPIKDCRSSSYIKKTADDKLIEIEDEIIDDFEVDCTIIDERSTYQGLEDKESSYIFHVSNENDYTANIMNATKRKPLSTFDQENENTCKKQKSSSLCNLRDGCFQKNSFQKTTKENSSGQNHENKLSHLTLPLRLLNL